MPMFNLTSDDLTEKQAIHTTREIYQQPEVWEEVTKVLMQKQEWFQQFVEAIYTKHEQIRVIFTGAGTSAFIGDILVPELSRQNQCTVQFEAIPTTDIVSNPREYLFKESPTIMVSFARSGNSPESVASVALGEKMIKDFYQVIITCNKDGQLAKNCKDDENSFVLLMPDKANDQSLAMTSSFSSMVITAYALFSKGNYTEKIATQLVDRAKKLLPALEEQMDEVMGFDFNRVVYLGSGLLAQLAHEAALKMLELTAGKVIALHESSLGFRHGPKSVLNDQSLVVLFISQDAYTRKYDLDILRELAGANAGMKIVALMDKPDKEVQDLADWVVSVHTDRHKIESDLLLGLLYIIFAQTLALNKSSSLGISPDNPSPKGEINRVVQGVTIYDYEG